jgi:hypothetical protein
VKKKKLQARYLSKDRKEKILPFTTCYPSIESSLIHSMVEICIFKKNKEWGYKISC